VLVLDNEGGAIFEELPIAEFPDVHARHFLTSARADITQSAPVSASIAEAHSPDALAASRSTYVAAPRCQIILPRTERAADKDLRASLRADAARAIERTAHGAL